MADTFLRDIEWLTSFVRSIRIAQFGEGEDEMAMQLKGLRAKAASFRSALDGVGQAYDEGSTAANAHAADVKGLAEEFKDMKSDLDFAIGLVGNSSAVTGTATAGQGEAEKPVDKPLAQAGVGDPNEPKPAPALQQKPLNGFDRMG